MKKINILFGFLFVLISFSVFKIAFASLEITEVMFDPEGADTNREWIKVHNDGDESITIISGKSDSAWRFGDGPTGDALHYINDTIIIESGEYAILAGDKDTFLSENSFDGEVADTSMNLSNTGGIVKIFDGSKPRRLIASKSYSNEEVENIEEESGGDDDSDSGTTISSKKKEEPFVLKITTKIVSPKTVVAGVPFTLDSLTTTNSGLTYMVGKFVWNFGDGMSKQFNKSVPFEYYYDYPGEYILNLSYYDNVFTTVPDATNRVTIKVTEPLIYISSIGDIQDPYVEIESKSNYETDLSNWIITTPSTKSFVFPSGTILLPNKKIKLSPKITMFTNEDIKSLIISNPNREIIVTYPSNNKLIKSLEASSTTKKDIVIPEEKVAEVINLNDLAANAGEAKTKISTSTYAFIGLAFVILVGISSFLVVKKKDNLDSEVKDLSIIE